MTALPPRRESFRLQGVAPLDPTCDMPDGLAPMAMRWFAGSAGGAVPSRSLFGLPDLPAWLRGITNLLAVEDRPGGGYQFRFRVWGSRQRMRTLLPPTGNLLEDVIADPEYRDLLQQHYTSTVVGGQLRLDRLSMLVGEGRDAISYQYDRLLLPLSGPAGGTQVSFLMTCVHRTGVSPRAES